MTEHADAGIGMDKIEIRQLVRIAGGQKLRAAIALAADGRAIILLDRHKQPRVLEREIKEQAPGSRLHRFGFFMADADDAKLARFTLNRAAPGMARRLVKALKGTGMRRVEIGLEDGSEAEAAEDEDGDQDVQVYDPAARRDAAEQRARLVALSRELLALAERIAAAEAARRAELVEMAEAAQGGLKRDRLEDAARAIEALRRALGVKS